MPKKIRTGQMYKYNFIFIVGEEEKTVKVSMSETETFLKNRMPMVGFDDVVKQLVALRESKRSDNKLQ